MKNNRYLLLIPGMFLCLILIVSFFPSKQYVPPLELTKPVDTKGVSLPVSDYGEVFVRYDSVRYLDIVIKNNRMKINEAYPPYTNEKLIKLMNHVSEINIYADTNCTMRFRKRIIECFRPYSDGKINYVVLDQKGKLNKLEEKVIGHGSCRGCCLVRMSHQFEVLVNDESKFMVEKNPVEKDSIWKLLVDFYRYGGGYSWGKLQNKESIEKDLARYKKAIIYYPDDIRYADSLKKWTEKLKIVSLIGEYSSIPEKASIQLQMSNSNSYRLFIDLVEQFEKSRRFLINKLIRERFKMSVRVFELFYFEEDLKLIEKVYPRLFKTDWYMIPPRGIVVQERN